MNKLRIFRTVAAVLVLASITFLFVDVSGFGADYFSWLAIIQFLPALFACHFGVVAAIVLLTFVFGRIYCSVVCPLGIMQDVFAFFGKKSQKRRYSYSHPRRALRIVFLTVFVIAFALGAGSFVALLAPYSSFGRIAQNLIQPVYQAANNLLAFFAEKADSYAFVSVDVWMRSWSTFLVALLTLVVIGFLAWRNGRTYCNTVCPVGTLLGFFSRFSLFAPVIDSSKCAGCQLCAKNCKAACINVVKGDVAHIDGSRCVTCFDCIDSCSRGAVEYKLRNVWRRRTADVVANRMSNDGEKTDASDNPGGDEGRRSFLVGLGLVFATAARSQEDKVVDGGLAIIADKRPAKRLVELVPPGAVSLRNFSRHCTGCQLCVAQCPNGVLRPSSSLLSLMQPRVSYERGYCRPECNVCSQVCPAGAIKPLSLEDKSSTVIGHAVWVADNCIVNADGVKCGNCARHCPYGAISMINHPDNPDLRIPAVNEDRCIGCGACEHVCPSRPFSAIYVEGHENHRLR